MSRIPSALEMQVDEALDNGYENNPELALWTASDLAADLCAYCSDFETYEPNELVPYCEVWLIQFAGRP